MTRRKPEEERLPAGRPPGSLGNGMHAPDDPDTLGLLRQKILEGLTPHSAASAIGIPRSTYYDWMAARPDFSEHVNQAVHDLKAKMAATVAKAGATNWVAAMTLLERLFPEEYGKRDRVRHEHAGQVGLTVQPLRMDAEAIKHAAALEESLGTGTPLLEAHYEEADSGDGEQT